MAEDLAGISEYQVSIFGSPVPNNRTEQTINSPHPAPVRTYQHNQQCQYEIVFPAGAMGLELEPVITSSERTIGCRVKDFYFGISYDGIDQSFLQEHIMIGDIIAKINETPVVSLPFNSILDLLRSLTGTSRTIVFKNITASCTTYYFPIFSFYPFIYILMHFLIYLYLLTRRGGFVPRSTPR